MDETARRRKKKSPLPEAVLRQAMEERRENLLLIKERRGLSAVQAKYLRQIEEWLAERE